MSKEQKEQIEHARANLRALIFDLAGDDTLSTPLALHLMQHVDQTLHNPDDQPPSIAVPHTLYVDEGDDWSTWRAYPSDDTTIEELHRACAAFDLKPWALPDCRIVLIARLEFDKVRELPDANQLAEAMFGRRHVDGFDDDADNAAAHKVSLDCDDADVAADAPAMLKNQAD